MVSIASHIDAHRPERVPVFMPARRPAWDRSWQGDPPVMMSTGSTWVQSIFVMSPRLGASGKLWARIFDGAFSISLTHARRESGNTFWTAKSSPPFNSPQKVLLWLGFYGSLGITSFLFVPRPMTFAASGGVVLGIWGIRARVFCFPFF